MINHKNKYLLFLLLIMWPCLSASEPSRTIEKFMNEPISMLDFGIYKLKMHLNSELKSAPFDETVSVDYDWENNIIAINLFVATKSIPEKLRTKENINKLCGAMVRDIKQYLDIDPNTGKSIFGAVGVNMIKDMFSHSGYSSKDISNGWKMVEKIISIKAFISTDRGTKTCTTELTEPNIYYSQ